MQEVVDWLHNRGQKYVVIVDPAVAYNRTIDGHDYGTFIRGEKDGIFLMRNDSEIYKGVVWPGVVAYPDWVLLPRGMQVYSTAMIKLTETSSFMKMQQHTGRRSLRSSSIRRLASTLTLFGLI